MVKALFDKQKTAVSLRKQGSSLSQIVHALHVSKSSASLWVRSVRLTPSMRKHMENRITLGQKKAVETMKNRRAQKEAELRRSLDKSLSSIKMNPPILKLLCSIFYWTEGTKNPKTRVAFTNSDPEMIRVFLYLFRAAFQLDENKFRALVHIHDYHNDEETRKYWSSLTQIPIAQFHRSYRKKSTHFRKKEGYKGTICIVYYDSQIALEIRLLYNMFAQNIRSVIQW